MQKTLLTYFFLQKVNYSNLYVIKISQLNHLQFIALLRG